MKKSGKAGEKKQRLEAAKKRVEAIPSLYKDAKRNLGYT